MSYSCLEELQVDLDLHMLDKTSVLSKAGRKYNDGWLIVTDDGYCHLFDKDGNLDNIKKVTQLEENNIRNDITKIVIPDNVTSIGYSVFLGCNKLTSVTIPTNVTSIGLSTFGGCSSLISVMIGNCVTSIGGWAFFSCSSLTSVTIPNSVKSIGNSTFYNCDALANLIFKEKTFKQVKKMNYYPWGIKDESIIKVG